MKKIAMVAATIIVATMSVASTAFADGRNGNDNEWRRGPQVERQDRDGNHRGRDTGFRDPGDRDLRHGHDRNDWRRDHRFVDRHWRPGPWRPGYWGPGYWGPRVVIRPGYVEPVCFVKKVKRYDAWGYLHVKRVRVCR